MERKFLSGELFQLIKYGFFGAITTIINLLLFYIFTLIGIQYLVSNAISYFIAVVLSYYLNNNYVFDKKNQGEIKKIIKFVLVRIASLGLDSIFLWLCVSLLNYDVFISKIIISVVIILITFVVNKTVVFDEKKRKKYEKKHL